MKVLVPASCQSASYRVADSVSDADLRWRLTPALRKENQVLRVTRRGNSWVPLSSRRPPVSVSPRCLARALSHVLSLILDQVYCESTRCSRTQKPKNCYRTQNTAVTGAQRRTSTSVSGAHTVQAIYRGLIQICSRNGALKGTCVCAAGQPQRP